MKKIITIALSVAVLALCIIGCTKQQIKEVALPTQVTSTDDLAISDPQIKEEIEFMRCHNMISKSTYDKWISWPRKKVLLEFNLEGDVKKISSYIIPYESETGSHIDNESISRAQVQNEMKKVSTNASPLNRMKRFANMFDAGTGLTSASTIKCRVITTGSNAVTTDWITALDQAISVWNGLGLKVKFSRVTASTTTIVGGYVNIFKGSLSNYPGVFVYTDPINSPGYFSEAMIINTASTNTPDVNGKKYAFIHELGHVIGMAHTDAVVNGTSIFNTTLTCNDSPVSNSIMYSFGAYNQTFSAFSTCDKNNFKSYWGFGSLS